MRDVKAQPGESPFHPFEHRGWHFLCAAFPDEQGGFWPMVFCELVWPGGVPFVLVAPSTRASADLACDEARIRAVAWVEERTTDCRSIR